MDTYTDRYEEYLAQVPSLAAYSRERQKAPIFAYTSNLDVVLHWNVEAYNKILDTYLKEEPCVREGDTMQSMEDFARISSYYIQNGLGGNFDIMELSVCDCLKENFSSEFSLGGTCAQGAAAIGSLGFPVNIHWTDACREVAAMLNHEGTTAVRNGHKMPVVESASGEAPIYHFILQFNKGDKIKILGKETEIPLSNRLILFYDTVHKLVPISEEFLCYWEEAEEEPSSYLMSGFDAIIDTGIIEERLKRLTVHIEKVKKKHPDTILYFEGAFYMNPQVKEMVLQSLGSQVDIIGTNEEELADLIARMGDEMDVTKADEVIRGLDRILNHYSAGGAVLHTKDYSMYYGKEIKGVDIEKGLTIGNLMSATRARTGRYGTLEDCRETLKLALSAQGIAFAEAASRVFTGKRILKVVPSRYLERPKYTIGLGDTFVSGVHTCFIKR